MFFFLPRMGLNDNIATYIYTYIYKTLNITKSNIP